MRLVFRRDKHVRNRMAGDELKTIANINIVPVEYKGSAVGDH